MLLQRLLLSTALLGVLTSVSCLPKDQEEPPRLVIADQISGPENDVELILATAAQIVRGFREGDLDAVMDAISEDIILIPPSLPILKGKAQVRLFYRTQLEKIRLLEFAPSLDELVVCGDWAFSRGTAALVAHTDESDHPVQVFNRGLEIWKRQEDGSWKLTRAIGNR